METGSDVEGLGGALWRACESVIVCWVERCQESYAEVLSFRLFDALFRLLDALFRLLDALGGKLEVSECATSVKSDVAVILVYFTT
jgi:uncharacterized membrane protein YccC